MKNRGNVFGLTGNMGCGKSTIANLLSVHDDVYVFDCDSVAKEIMENDENLEEIKLILGDEVVVNNKIDKQKVSQIIFNNKEKKQKLENFIHPKVWEKLSDIINECKDGTIFVVESAILFEIGWQKRMNGVILAVCDKKEQMRRLKQRNNWTNQEIKERLKNQIPDSHKKSESEVIIDTNCTLNELARKVKILYEYLKEKSDKRLYL